MIKSIDVNADLAETWGVYPTPQQVWRAAWDRGEGTMTPDSPIAGSDIETILSIISSASLACGFHSGDPVAIKRYVLACAEQSISIGAHPAYPDLVGFGNRSMALSRTEITSIIQYQVAALDGLVRMAHGRLRHVKLHGALYHDAYIRRDVADAVSAAVAEYDRSLVVFGLPNGALHHACRSAGLRFASEGFPDRAYLRDGGLVPRANPGSMIQDPADVAERARTMAVDGYVTAHDGSMVKLVVETLCIHPDTPNAARSAVAVRRCLEAHGLHIASMLAAPDV